MCFVCPGPPSAASYGSLVIRTSGILHELFPGTKATSFSTADSMSGRWRSPGCIRGALSWRAQVFVCIPNCSGVEVSGAHHRRREAAYGSRTASRLDTEFAPHGQGTAETDGPRQPHPEKLWLSTGMIIHDNCLLMSCDGAVSSESRRHCATCVLRRASECLSVVPFRSASFLMCGAATRKWPVAISTATMCVSASGKRSSRCSNAPRRSMPWPPRPRIRYVRFRPLREADVGRVPVKRIEQDLLANFPKPKTNFTSPDPAQRGEVGIEEGFRDTRPLASLAT